MAHLILRHRRYSARVRVPKERQAAYGGREHLQRTLDTSDRKVAEARAGAWEASLRIEWMAHDNPHLPEAKQRRALYRVEREKAEAGTYQRTPAPEDEGDPVAAGIGAELDRMGDEIGERELTATEETRLWALQDALSATRGQPVKPRRELEPAFGEVADGYMKLWRNQRGLKDTNTDQQKQATFGLFKGFWKDQPMRGITSADAAAFHDALIQFNPSWARSPAAKGMTWAELVRRFGGQAQGLSAGTMNRHMATLQALWDYARKRGYCSGDNPFSGFRKRLKGANRAKGYLAWEDDELRELMKVPPKRQDVRELMIVAMFSGLRINEAASLTWDQIRTEDEVSYFQVQDAKTEAGNRQVPIHPALSWLTERPKGHPLDLIWSTFNPEGPGKKPGADAGKEFSRFKAARGFTDRQKAFHSFRKNVTRQIERAGVPENEWAEILGHEKAFTFRTYGAGITLRRKAEIIGLIGYPGLEKEIEAFREGGLERPERVLQSQGGNASGRDSAKPKGAGRAS